MGDVEAGGSIATVDNHADSDGICAVLAALGERFDDASTACDDILDNKDLFAGLELEVAAELELVIDFFEKEEPEAELASDFLTDDEAAHGRTDYGGRAIVFEHRQS